MSEVYRQDAAHDQAALANALATFEPFNAPLASGRPPFAAAWRQNGPGFSTYTLATCARSKATPLILAAHRGAPDHEAPPDGDSVGLVRYDHRNGPDPKPHDPQVPDGVALNDVRSPRCFAPRSLHRRHGSEPLTENRTHHCCGPSRMCSTLAVFALPAVGNSARYRCCPAPYPICDPSPTRADTSESDRARTSRPPASSRSENR